MLNLLIGSDRIYLSNHILKQISDNADRGLTHQILIVPEQFSHEAERSLCKAGGPPINRYAEVLSLSRLSDRVASICGGTAKEYLDKGGQLLAMASAAEQVSSRLKLYASVLRKPEFLSSMVQIINEFQSYCLAPQALLDASHQMDGIFAQKLEELGYLYESYLSICANGKADPADKLFRLREEIEESDWASDYTFYVDGYSDFTGAESLVLEALLKHAKDVHIALVIAGEQYHAESASQETMKSLQLTAAKWGISAKTTIISGCSARSKSIERLLRSMFSSGDVSSGASQAIQIYRYQSIEEECKDTALRVKKLLRSGIRCRDISIACTEPSVYRAPVSAAFSAAQIPFYIAGENDVLSSPIIGAVLNTLAAAVSPLEYEDVALYLKSGLPMLQKDLLDRLDNYAYLWNLKGTQWEHPFENHPRGFGLPWEEGDRAYLETLEHSRLLVLTPFLQLRKRLFASENSGTMAQVFYVFLEDMDLPVRLEAEAVRQLQAGNGALAQELQQTFDLLTQSLKQIWLIAGDTVRTPEDFYHLYQMLLSQYKIGTIPVGLDQVQISDLPDLRYRSTRHLFVLGAHDGAFPAYQGADGVLTEDERRKLIHLGLSIAPGRSEQLEREIDRIYAAMSAAQETLGLSYAGDQPAWLLRRAIACYPTSLIEKTDSTILNLEEYAAWKIRHNYPTTAPAALADMQQQLTQRASYRFTSLQEKTVLDLYGRKLNLSASKIDRYASCRFSFFLMYGLRAQPKKQAKLDAPAFGTFVHEVLEHTVQKVSHLGGFQQVEEPAILEIATEEINTYASKYFPEQTKRDIYLFRRSTDEIMQIVHDLWEELSHSQFQPAACELSFADNGVLPAVEICGKKAVCKLTGFVDRIDVFKQNGQSFVRVVDYKTGPKEFDYTDILNGAGLQMLIYLFALRQYGSEYLSFGNLEPAGVLYMPAKKQFVLTEAMPDSAAIVKAHQKSRRRQGLIREDEQLLRAMEADPDSPVFMPYDVKKGKKQGDLASRRQMLLLERHVLRSVAEIADGIVSGDVMPNPIVRGQTSSCTYCDYRTVCHKDLGMQTPREFAKTSAADFWDKLEQEEEDNG